MQTKVVKIDSANIDDAAMKEACDLIRAGELVAFPTEGGCAAPGGIEKDLCGEGKTFGQSADCTYFKV